MATVERVADRGDDDDDDDDDDGLATGVVSEPEWMVWRLAGPLTRLVSVGGSLARLSYQLRTGAGQQRRLVAEMGHNLFPIYLRQNSIVETSRVASESFKDSPVAAFRSHRSDRDRLRAARAEKMSSAVSERPQYLNQIIPGSSAIR